MNLISKVKSSPAVATEPKSALGAVSNEAASHEKFESTKTKLCDQRVKTKVDLRIVSRISQAFPASRRARHDQKLMCRHDLARALETMQSLEHQNHDKANTYVRRFVDRCQQNGLDIGHELSRSMPKDKHPLAEMIDAGYFQGLVLMAPFLPPGVYGPIAVTETSEGTYIGEVAKVGKKSHAAQGSGLLVRADTSYVAGTWKDNEPYGRMITRPASGTIDFYHVPIVGGALNGEGIAKYKNGATISCGWTNGVREGPGLMTLPDGGVLSATWHNDIVDSECNFTSQDGRVYRGRFAMRDGRPHGQSSIHWSRGPKSGGYYEGHVELGEPDGIGCYTFAVGEDYFGTKYQGPWLKGEKHGVGVLVGVENNEGRICAFDHDCLMND